ncbi:unnamed protein product [Cylindrotheca closterium]|uniref:Uncharacterized protein n=1 Tax=Cylindrotheca closterium TaxID=2856 RepID=A0AAD2FK52_9STRA|nr:unnamed protein product [Cylindrotheca closterium]
MAMIKKENLNQIGATVPANVPAIVPGTSASTSGASSVAGSVNTSLQLAGTTAECNLATKDLMIAAEYRATMDSDADNDIIVHYDGDRKMQFVNCKGVYMLEQLGANVEPGAKETSAM